MTTTTVKAQRRSFDIKAFLAANGALVGLVVLCLALFIATPDFLTGRNLLNIGIQVSTVQMQPAKPPEEVKEAFDDAISATKAAMAEGVVPGGGLALLRSIVAVDRLASECHGDERTGVLMLKRALETPTRQIAENSGVDGGVVLNQMRAGIGN